jgi:hypothetical protein
MFKNILGDLSKFLTRDKIIIVVALAILAYALFSYSNAKDVVMDLMEDGSAEPVRVNGPVIENRREVENNMQEAPSSGYAVQPIANPNELLPTDQNSQWAALNPVAANPGAIAMPDLLQPGYHIGLDTIGQTLRNANLQLRSDPIIPKADVGPWMNSTIEPDLGRVPLEIGYGAR